MQIRRFTALSMAAGLAVSLWVTTATAQAPTDQLVEMGGSVQAVAEECKTHTAAQLSEMRAQQRLAIGDMGVSGEAFDKAFDAAYERTRAKIKGGSAEQRAEMCEQMKAISASGTRG